jgi:hypothetical protein
VRRHRAHGRAAQRPLARTAACGGNDVRCRATQLDPRSRNPHHCVHAQRLSIGASAVLHCRIAARERRAAPYGHTCAVRTARGGSARQRTMSVATDATGRSDDRVAIPAADGPRAGWARGRRRPRDGANAAATRSRAARLRPRPFSTLACRFALVAPRAACRTHADSAPGTRKRTPHSRPENTAAAATSQCPAQRGSVTQPPSASTGVHTSLAATAIRPPSRQGGSKSRFAGAAARRAPSFRSYVRHRRVPRSCLRDATAARPLHSNARSHRPPHGNTICHTTRRK